MSQELPRRFGKYLLLRRIALGGMAELFLARKQSPGDLATEKLLAIKRILPQFTTDEEFIAMFLNEARLASLLNHALLIRTYDLGRAEDTLFIAMEYVDGVNLREIGKMLRRAGRGMPPAIAASIGARVAEALDYAHRLTAPTGQPLRLVHRDVSPDNILLTRDGYVKLADFGIAKAFALNPLTNSQSVKGKLHYMAPEQLTGGALDGRSDLFSLGVTLYLMVTGHYPFTGPNHAAVMQAIAKLPAPPPSKWAPGFPPELERILMRLLEKEPAKRFATGAELSQALDRFAVTAGGSLTAREVAEFLVATESKDEEGRANRADPLSVETAMPQPTAPPVASADNPRDTLTDGDSGPQGNAADDRSSPSSTLVEDSSGRPRLTPMGVVPKATEGVAVTEPGGHAPPRATTLETESGARPTNPASSTAGTEENPALDAEPETLSGAGPLPGWRSTPSPGPQHPSSDAGASGEAKKRRKPVAEVHEPPVMLESRKPVPPPPPISTTGETPVLLEPKRPSTSPPPPPRDTTGLVPALPMDVEVPTAVEFSADRPDRARKRSPVLIALWVIALVACAVVGVLLLARRF